jgi:hypothetical protein
VTAFFLPGTTSGGKRSEAAYRELRERSQVIAGCAPRPARIFQLSYRVHGHDSTIEVGRPLVDGGDVVLAILDHGHQEGFVVHTSASVTCTPLRVKRPVYSTIEFS